MREAKSIIIYFPAWGIHRKVCHASLKDDKVFKQPPLGEEETNFLRNCKLILIEFHDESTDSTGQIGV